MQSSFRVLIGLVLLGASCQGAADARFSPDGSRVARSVDARVEIWGVADKTLIATTEPHDGPVSAFDFSSDGGQLLTGSRDGTARLWAASDAAELQRFEIGEPVTLARLSPAGVRFAVADASRRVMLWDRYSDDAYASNRFPADVVDLDFAAAGGHLLVRTADGQLWLWDLLADGKPVPIGAGALTESPAVRMHMAATLDDWIGAWEARDLESYLAYYDDRFVPEDRTPRERWRAERERRLSAARWIEIALSDLEVDRLSDGRLRARFVQDYASDRYADRCEKTLELTDRGDTWRILRETSSACVRTRALAVE